VLSGEEANAAKSFRNLEGVVVLAAENAGIADILRPATLVASQAAIDALTVRAAKQRTERTQRTSSASTSGATEVA
jgi:ribosomal protein L4